MKHIYFVRHGQTSANVNDTVQPPDTPLDEVGLIQAERIAERAAKLNFSSLITSDFLRTKKTAERIAVKTGVTAELSPLFREVKNITSLHGVQRSSDEYQAYSEVARTHDDDPTWHYEDEESMADIIKRCGEAKAFLEAHAADNHLVVSHGLFLRYFLGTILLDEHTDPITRRRFHRKLSHSNVGLTLYEVADEKWKLIVWNDHAHLAE